MIGIETPPATFASMKQPPPPVAGADADQASLGTSARRILIVEDEAVVAMEIAALLEEAGYVVVGTAASEAAALAAAQQHDPDVVLMDITLQGGDDGIATAERIRRECDIPSIFLSAASDSATIGRARSIGAGFIRKPYDPRQLLRTLAAVLGG